MVVRDLVRAAIAGSLSLFAGAPAAAQWNQANDESNRQTMMAEMRASAAANDRANEESQRRFNDNAARASASSSSTGGSSGYTGASSAPSGGTGSGSYRDAGPRSIVATYRFTIHRQESRAALVARLSQEATNGDALSAYNLGRVYYTGFDGLPRNDEQARKWFAAGASLGHPGAQAQYGYMLHDGVGGTADLASALAWLKKAAVAGDPYGSALYGFYRVRATSLDSGISLATEVGYLERAADAGQLVAQSTLGLVVYKFGHGVPADHEKAARFTRMAADQGYAPAQTELGERYIYGQGVARDPSLAVAWLRKASAQHSARADGLLGRLTLDGSGGLTADPVAAAHRIKAASDAGDIASTGFYGVLLQHGIGVDRDMVAGAAYLKRAAETHDPDAEQNYAIAFFNGQGVPQDVPAGVAWQKRAADDGNIDAIATYAVRLSTGAGVQKDVVEGVRYARLAAERGSGARRGVSRLGLS